MLNNNCIIMPIGVSMALIRKVITKFDSPSDDKKKISINNSYFNKNYLLRQGFAVILITHQRNFEHLIFF